ncbi:hypothetical protein DDR33_07105 [Pararcticibacter amylolyticus]|uniref:Uncharacterized protein n=1 Tax=Pararcticibacter amylolyticus TaxID=2173175 RepID=A0A2U2PK07_9SPHI|nr:hypothetical protein DDR33_07105 [Pararcticibacter amylolyticus]
MNRKKIGPQHRMGITEHPGWNLRCMDEGLILQALMRVTEVVSGIRKAEGTEIAGFLTIHS